MLARRSPCRVLCLERITERRFARFEPDPAVGSARASPLSENFLHKSLGMLNGPLRPLLRAREPRICVRPRLCVEQSNGSKHHILSMFPKMRINFACCIARSRHVAQRARRTCSARRNIWCRLPSDHARSCKNTGFFAAL